MGGGGPFRNGELCLLYDSKGRQHLTELTAGKAFHYDRGSLSHDVVIGALEGSTLRSSNGSPLVAVRPRYADYVLNMKRGAAVMYPKDVAAMIMWADVGPAMTVLEAGTGSGALTMAAARAVGESGAVVTVERRDDHAIHARRLIEALGDSVPSVIEYRAGDVADHLAEVQPDRVLLDVPEPWAVVPVAAEQLSGGAVFACYLPTVPQVQTVREAMDDAGVFFEIDTFEVLMRHWTIDGRSVRPDHRMIGHTGFITVGRTRRTITTDEAGDLS